MHQGMGKWAKLRKNLGDLRIPVLAGSYTVRTVRGRAVRGRAIHRRKTARI